MSSKEDWAVSLFSFADSNNKGDTTPKTGENQIRRSKKDNFPSMDYTYNVENRGMKKSPTYRDSPIERNKEFDSALCQEFLDALPEVEVWDRFVIFAQ